MSDAALALLRGRRLVVFDLDGTLYEQGPVRRAMLAELLVERGGRLSRLRALRTFRRMREAAAETAPSGFDAALFERFTRATGLTDEAARALVAEWMEARPLRHLARAVVPGAPALFAALRAAGTRVAVWSDYPARAKLDALGLTADHVISATDPDLDALKPDPAGLERAMTLAGAGPDDTLMIGDRTERDGAAAAAAGTAFLLRARRGPPGVPRVADFAGLAAAS